MNSNADPTPNGDITDGINYDNLSTDVAQAKDSQEKVLVQEFVFHDDDADNKDEEFARDDA